MKRGVDLADIVLVCGSEKRWLFFFSCFIFSAPITKDLRLLKCGIWKISHLKHKTHSDHFRNYNTWYLKAFKITEKQIFASLLYWGYLVLISLWASNLFKIFFAQKFINSSIQKCVVCVMYKMYWNWYQYEKKILFFSSFVPEKWAVDGASFFLFQHCKYFLFIIHLTEVLCLYKVILLLYTSMVEYTWGNKRTIPLFV